MTTDEINQRKTHDEINQRKTHTREALMKETNVKFILEKLR